MHGLGRGLSAVLAVCLMAPLSTQAAPVTTPGAAASAVPANSIPAPVDPARLALAHQIIAVMFPPSSREEIFGGLVMTMLAQYRASLTLPKGMDDPGLRKILDDTLDGLPQRMKPVIDKNVPLIIEATAHAYAREFSLAELNDILAFAHTPAGRHYLSRAPSLMSDPDVAAANRAYFAEVREYSSTVRLEVTQQVRDYLVKHPEVLAKMKGEEKAGQ